MGMFSWLTSDTQESIIAWPFNKGEQRTVYMLRPNGEAPIAEPQYEGYGDFGDVDAYDWLARANVPAETLAPLSDEDVRLLGVHLGVGNYYLDTQTGKKLAIFHKGGSLFDPDIIEHPGITYGAPLSDYDGKCANDLIAEGRLVRKSYELKYPLKFSYDPNACYEDLPAAKDCPKQGGLIADDDDEDDLPA